MLRALAQVRNSLDQCIEMLTHFTSTACWFGLPPTHPHPQRDAVQALMQDVVQQYQEAVSKWSLVSKWVGWRNYLMHTPIPRLGDGHQRLMHLFFAHATHLFDELTDAATIKMVSDIKACLKLLPTLSILQEPGVSTPSHWKSLFWAVGLEYPDTEDYHMSITMAHVVGWDLLPAVRRPLGSSWKDGDDPSAQDLTALLLSPQLDGVSTESGQPVSTGVTSSQIPTADQLQQAKTLAAHATATVGCSICNSHLLSWVGLSPSADCDSVALCLECYPEYKTRPSVHKLLWVSVADLLSKEVSFLTADRHCCHP